MSHRPITYLTVLALYMASCAPPKDETTRVEPDLSAPSMVLVVKEVKGQILKNRLNQPVGLAVDFRGDIIVTDAGNDRLLKFDTDLTPKLETGGYGGQLGLLNRPTYLAFDNELNLMVADEGNRRLSRFNSSLNFVDEILFSDDEDPFKFGYPSGIAFTEYGEIWVADREKFQIAVFNNVGTFDRILGDDSYAGGRLSSPEKIVRDRQGNFIVCDAGNSRLVYFDSYGNLIRESNQSQWVYPVSVADDNRFMWVLDKSEGVLYCVNRREEIVFETGPNIPGTDTPLRQPSDIIFLLNGELLIADTGNNRLLLCRIAYEDE